MSGSTYGREGGDLNVASSLGALREEFGRSEKVRSQYGVFAAVGFGLGLLFIWLDAWLPGAIFLALGVFMTWGLLRQRGVRVRIYERGFSFTRGRRTREFPWDEIESFSESQVVYRHARTGLESGTGYSYLVRRRGGESLKMDNEVGGRGPTGRQAPRGDAGAAPAARGRAGRARRGRTLRQVRADARGRRARRTPPRLGRRGARGRRGGQARRRRPRGPRVGRRTLRLRAQRPCPADAGAEGEKRSRQ